MCGCLGILDSLLLVLGSCWGLWARPCFCFQYILYTLCSTPYVSYEHNTKHHQPEPQSKHRRPPSHPAHNHYHSPTHLHCTTTRPLHRNPPFICVWPKNVPWSYGVDLLGTIRKMQRTRGGRPTPRHQWSLVTKRQKIVVIAVTTLRRARMTWNARDATTRDRYAPAASQPDGADSAV